MTSTSTGWVVFLTAMGAMLAFMAVDVSTLTSWHDATTPAFVGSMLGHVGTMIGAFVGGRLIPTGTKVGT